MSNEKWNEIWSELLRSYKVDHLPSLERVEVATRKMVERVLSDAYSGKATDFNALGVAVAFKKMALDDRPALPDLPTLLHVAKNAVQRGICIGRHDDNPNNVFRVDEKKEDAR